MSDDDVSVRVRLTKAELLHLKGFAGSVDDVEHDAWWAQLTAKLEKAIVACDRPPRKPRRVPPAKPDDRPARCRACGWGGTLTKTGPCPKCGEKCNPYLFYCRHTHPATAPRKERR